MHFARLAALWWASPSRQTWFGLPDGLERLAKAKVLAGCRFAFTRLQNTLDIFDRICKARHLKSRKPEVLGTFPFQQLTRLEAEETLVLFLFILGEDTTMKSTPSTFQVDDVFVSCKRNKRTVLSIMVVTMVALCTGCQHIIPPRTIVPPPPPPISSDSGISAKVTVDLQAAANTLSNSLPKTLDSATEKVNVPANVTIMVPTDVVVDVVSFVPRVINKAIPKSITSTCKKKGILKFIFFPCQLTQMVNVTETVMDRVVTPTVQKIDKATAVKTPVNVDLTHDVYLETIGLSAEGNQIVARATISYDVDVKADAKLVKIGLTSCGIGEPKPEITITQPMHVHWNVDGKLAIDKEPSTLDWTKPCNLTFADLDLKSVLRITGLQHRLDDQIDNALSKIPPQLDLDTALDSLWSSLEEPQPIAKDVWLSVRPTGANISDPYGEGLSLGFSVAVTAYPVVAYGDKPTPEHEVRPPLEHTQAPDEFSIELEGAADFKDIEKVLNSEFANKDHDVSGHTIRVSDITVYPSGSNVIISANVEKPFHARLYLYGTPLYDENTNTLAVTGLDYTAETKNFLVKVADWILHSKFQNDLQAKAKYPASPYLAEAREKLKNYQGKNGNVSFTVQASNLSVESIFVTERGLHVRTLIKGKASAVVQ